MTNLIGQQLHLHIETDGRSELKPKRARPAQWRRVPAAVVGILGYALLPYSAAGEEGGSGHYFPGSMASFIDGVPPAETVLVRFNGLYYDGSAGLNRPLPIGGLTTVGASARSWGAGLTALWRPALDLGEQWSYAMSATIPFINLDVAGNVSTTLPNGLTGTITRSSSIGAVGDVVLMPLMLNYKVNSDFNINARLGFYAPTGSYQVGRLANTSKNFWTTEPAVGLMYFGQTSGIEASAFVGLDLNSENTDTHYKSGTQFHIDGTIAQHLPWAGGLAGFGLSAYYYQQITDDTGSGATLGAFRGKSVGLGPALSFVHKIDGHDTLWELKWLHEMQTENRMQGDLGWLKAAYKF